MFKRKVEEELLTQYEWDENEWSIVVGYFAKLDRKNCARAIKALDMINEGYCIKRKVEEVEEDGTEQTQEG